MLVFFFLFSFFLFSFAFFYLSYFFLSILLCPSFLLKRTSNLYGRRSSKIVTGICSLFTSSYVMNWSKFFAEKVLQYPPSFDGRAVCYPSETNVRDYFSWRQADCKKFFRFQLFLLSFITLFPGKQRGILENKETNKGKREREKKIPLMPLGPRLLSCQTSPTPKSMYCISY